MVSYPWHDTVFRKIGMNHICFSKNSKNFFRWIVIIIAIAPCLQTLFPPPTAEAIPAFARKYQVDCTVCHTRYPRLNNFGERFLENGYQMPGTEDGGIVRKMQLGNVALDDISNYMGFLFAGNILDYSNIDRKIPGGAEDRVSIGDPILLRILTAGTISHNIGFFISVQSLFSRSEDVELDRAFLSFNNIGKFDLAHIRIGRLDPSAYFSFPTHRPQIVPVGPQLGPPFGFLATPTVNRIPIFPSAFSSKFYGLFDQSGTAILPFEETLFNSTQETGIDVHGRPFGKWFLYQAGILNGANQRIGDSNNSKDWYVLGRLDYAESDYFSANISGFAYFGDDNAKIAFNFTDVSRNRYGVGARIRYKMFDVYGAYTIDRITDLPTAVESTFDPTATGLTLEGHVLITDRWLLGLRYDNLDAGGTLATRKSLSLVTFQAKYYLRSNIYMYGRHDLNLRDDEGGTSPARNFRYGLILGVDAAF